ncbi:MAG: hypothetical protein AAFV85_25090 [Cyanobacteria bacterium J06634_6]
MASSTTRKFFRRPIWQLMFACLFFLGGGVALLLNRPGSPTANCGQLVPYLNRYQVSEGRYPTSLTELDQFSALPKNINTRRCEYLGREDEFTLLTSTFFKSGYFHYDADQKEWIDVD